MAEFIYRTQKTNPEVLSRLLVGRGQLISNLLEDLRPGFQNYGHHHLLVGPRGIGKTSLLQVIFHLVDKDDGCRDKWLPLQFPEECYSVTTLADLSLNILNTASQAAEAVEEGGRRAAYAEPIRNQGLRDLWLRLIDEPDDDLVIRQCLEKFHDLQRACGCTLLLGVENFREMVGRLLRGRPHSEEIVARFLREAPLRFLATSTTPLHQNYHFRELFRQTQLPELTADEQLEALRRLAKQRRDMKSLLHIEARVPQIHALFHFTGGNPRQTQFLYNLLASQAASSLNLEAELDLEELVELSTPYFKDLMRRLSNQEAKIVQRLSLSPQTPAELARSLRIRSVRVALGRLVKLGYVKREECKKTPLYSVCVGGTVFRIWHQLNLGSQRIERVRSLASYLEGWYTRNQDHLSLGLHSPLRRPTESRRMSDYIEYVMVARSNVKFAERFHELRDAKHAIDLGDLRKVLKNLDEQFARDPDYFVCKGVFLASELDLQEEAIEAFLNALKIAPDHLFAIYNSGVALGRDGKLLQAYEAFSQTCDTLAPLSGSKGTSAAIEDLFYIIKEDSRPALGLVAAYLMAWLAEQVDKGELRRIHLRLRTGLETVREPLRRANCATALGSIRAKDSVELLIRSLARDEYVVAVQSARALGYIGDYRAVDSLVNIATGRTRPLREGSGGKKTPAIKLRSSAIWSLAQFNGTEASEALHFGARDSSQPLLRCVALDAMAMRNELSASDLVRGLLTDGSDRVRSRAARALGYLRSSESVPDLVTAGNDRVSSVRKYAAFALSQTGDARAIRCLVRLLQDSSIDVQHSAALGVCRLAEYSQIEDLEVAARKVIDLTRERMPGRLEGVVQMIVIDIFSTRDDDKARAILSLIGRCNGLEAIYENYCAALKYKLSGWDENIFYRLQPELRFALRMLLHEVRWVASTEERAMTRMA